MIKAILFDADGVVITSPQMFNQTLAQEHGLSTDKTLDFFMGPFQACLVGQADLKEEIQPFLESWGLEFEVDEFLNLWFESENHLSILIIDYINQLRNEGLSCFLATNQEKYRTNFMRNEMGLANIFDSIYSSADLGYRKPDQNFYYSLLKELQLEPHEVLFVDDSAKNVESAKEVGIRSHHFEDLGAFKKFIAINR